MSNESIAILAYMKVHNEEKNNQFTFEDFAPLGFPIENLKSYCEELERHGDIVIDNQFIQPVYFLP